MTKTQLVIAALLLVAAALILASQWLFDRIRKSNDSLFEKMGRPDVFRNNSPTSILAFWKFIYTRNLPITDKDTIVVIWFLRTVGPTYFCGVLLLMIFGSSSS